MKLPTPSYEYRRAVEFERNRQVEAADGENHKRGRDVEVGEARLILTASDGSRWSIEVDASGTLSTSSV